MKPAQRCARAGCPNKQPCSEHRPEAWEGSNRRAELGPHWTSTAARIRRRDRICRCPGCPKCSPAGCTAPTTDVDHIGDPLDHSDTNLRGLCSPCHNHRTAQQARNRTRKATP